MTTLVFVHGACVRDADWWWRRMRAPLARHGIGTVAVPLPSCGELGKGRGDLFDDADACRQAIARAPDGPVVLVGHSYGGMVVTEAGADDRVTRLVYVTSVMADVGESQGGLIGAEPAPWLDPSDDGTVGVLPDLVRARFLQDCDAETREAAVARLTRQSLAPFTQGVRVAAWQTTPASYVVCTDDLATPAETQRRHVRAGARTVEFPAGHHPFLSQPDTFADLLAAELATA